MSEKLFRKLDIPTISAVILTMSIDPNISLNINRTTANYRCSPIKSPSHLILTNIEPEHMSLLNHQIIPLNQPVCHLLLSFHHFLDRQERAEDHNVKRSVSLGGMNRVLGRRFVILT